MSDGIYPVPEYVDVELESIRRSLSSVLMLCKEWRHREPEKKDLSTVFRTQSLAATAAEVVPEQFDPSSRWEAASLDRFLKNRQAILPKHDPNLADVELHRTCSLHLVNLYGVTDDDVVFTETDGYIQQISELPPWDTWVWRHKWMLISWVPKWMQPRLNDGIRCESGGSHSWLRINADDRLELLGYSKSVVINDSAWNPFDTEIASSLDFFFRSECTCCGYPTGWNGETVVCDQHGAGIKECCTNCGQCGWHYGGELHAMFRDSGPPLFQAGRRRRPAVLSPDLFEGPLG